MKSQEASEVNGYPEVPVPIVIGISVLAAKNTVLLFICTITDILFPLEL